MKAELPRDYTKQVMAKSIRNQGRGAEIESGSVIHTGAQHLGGIVPEIVNKSAESVGVLRRTERAAAAPAKSSLKFDYRDPLVPTVNTTESREKLSLEKLLVAPLAVNRSLTQAVHG